MDGRLLSYAAGMLLLLATAGCGTTARVPPAEPDSRQRAASRYARPAPPPAHGTEARLRTEVDGWLGTPHRWGGTGRDGLDCSAFTQHVYADVFGLHLPRTTVDQVRVGRDVHPADLEAGDLVFFRPPTKTRHVGIYLSEGEFAHVSSSRGITISRLDQPYWQAAYWTARRVLPEGNRPAGEVRATGAPPATRPRPARKEPVEPALPARKARAGW